MGTLETAVFYSMIPLGMATVAAVVRYRAFLTPLKKNFRRLTWSELGRVVIDGKKYRPVGCARSGEKTLLLLVRQVVPKRPREAIIAEYDREGGGFSHVFRVPQEMLPIGDLACRGGNVYLAAHGARGLVRLDLAESERTGEAVVSGSVSTGLRRIGGLTFVEYRGRTLMAMADNRGKKRIYLVDPPAAMESGDFFAGVQASFQDTGHVKGITWDGQRLYKVARATGRDLIYRIDLDAAVETDSVTMGIESTMYAPTRDVGCVLAQGDRLLVGAAGSGRLYGTRVPTGG
jgi:hypothetical protein